MTCLSSYERWIFGGISLLVFHAARHLKRRLWCDLNESGVVVLEVAYATCTLSCPTTPTVASAKRTVDGVFPVPPEWLADGMMNDGSVNSSVRIFDDTDDAYVSDSLIENNAFLSEPGRFWPPSVLRYPNGQFPFEQRTSALPGAHFAVNIPYQLPCNPFDFESPEEVGSLYLSPA